MMQCPDPDQLLQLVGGSAIEPDLRAHVETCDSCGVEVLLMTELGHALQPAIDVPEELIQRVVENLRTPVAGSSPGATAVHGWASGALGAVTTVAVLLGTGAVGDAAPLALALSALLVGIASGLLQRRVGATPTVLSSV